MTKICEYCNNNYERPTDYSQDQWVSRRFCSRTCAAKVIHWTNAKERFERNFIPEPMSGCWIWIGSVMSEGYGQMRVNGRYYRAHRLSFELYNGYLPKNLGILHHCDNPSCVNPNHLYAGTAKDNRRDMDNRGRSLTGNKNHNTKLNADIVAVIRASKESNKVLGDRFGVSRTTIYSIRKHLSWKYVS